MRTSTAMLGALLLTVASSALGQSTFERDLAQARAGNVAAMVKVGEAYESGKGATQNYTEAFRWLSSASAKGSPRATRLLGEMHDDGLGVAKDPKEALRLYRIAAAKGDSRAMWRIAMAYLIGKAVPKDEVESVRWLRQSAAKGDTNGLNSLGVMYGKGSGVPQNFTEALRYYRLAADKGNTSALVNMAGMYERGEGVALDKAEAARLRAAAVSADPKQWRTFVAPAQPTTPALVAPEATSSRPSRFIFMINEASSRVTVYQDGIQKCVIEPDASCSGVWVPEGAATVLRAVLATGSEATYYRPQEGVLHICIADGPRFVECYTDRPL